MNEIKVTVTYEKPTTSKFDALMSEYEAAKKYADETVAYYKPLADVAEDTKFDAIIEQLETIKEYAKRISELSPYTVWLTVFISPEERGYGKYSWARNAEFNVIYDKKTNICEIRWEGSKFCKENMHKWPHEYCEKDKNIIGKWNEWKIYERLEREAISQLKRLIATQKEIAQYQINRLNNITKGGN